MKRNGVLVALSSLVAVMLLSTGLWAGAQGTFRGEVVSPPRGERTIGQIFLMGRDGNVRRVILSRAAIVFDSGVPSGERRKAARKQLVPGTEVRVTALVDAKSGEWTASRVEVISHHAITADEVDSEDENVPDDVTSSHETTIASRTI